MRHPLRSLAALSLLSLGACGSGATTDAGAPESVPYASTSTSAAPVTAPPTTAAPVSAAEPADTTPAGLHPAGSNDEMSAALITSLLSTEDGRAMMAEMMAQETGITQQQAACFLENVDPDTMLALSELGASGATPDPATLPSGVLDDLMGAVSTCAIAPEALLG